MRVLTDDILAVLDCLMAAPPAAREGLLAEIFARAQTAARFRQGEGRIHPQFGGGSLMAAAASVRAGPRVDWQWEDPVLRAQAMRLLGALGGASDENVPVPAHGFCLYRPSPL